MARLAHAPLQVYIASEMAHADVIAANARGVVVILTGQSTVERAYLRRWPRGLLAAPHRGLTHRKVHTQTPRVACGMRCACSTFARASHSRQCGVTCCLRAARSLRQELHDEFSRSDWNVKVKCSEVDCNPLSIV